MTVPVLIEQTNGQYEAKLAGEPSLRAVASTRDEAIRNLRTVLTGQYDRGKMIFLTLPTGMAISQSAGAFRDDETLDEMVAEIYRQRDAERPE